MYKLTCELSFDLMGRNGEDIEYLGYNLHKHFRHFCGQRNLSINPQTLEEALDTLKQFDEGIVARSHIFGRLYSVDGKRGPLIMTTKIQTERSTPIPVKMARAGGNAFIVTSGYTSDDYGLYFRDIQC